MKLDLTIIIVNWNTGKLLAECIDSIYDKTKGVSFEIIVVDNASTDNSLDLVTPRLDNLHIIKETINHGFGKANNIGLKRAIGEYICFLNPDTVLCNDAFSTMICELEKQGDNTAVAGPLVIRPDGTPDFSCSRSYQNVLKLIYTKSALEKIPFFPQSSKFNIYGDFKHNYLVPAISGSCMLLKREAMDQIGGFDERYFMYGEDMDLCFTAGKYGYSLIFVSNAKILHYGGASSNTISGPMELASIISECIYLRKNHSKAAELVYRALLVPLYIFKTVPHIIFLKNEKHRLRVSVFWDIIKLASGFSGNKI